MKPIRIIDIDRRKGHKLIYTYTFTCSRNASGAYTLERVEFIRRKRFVNKKECDLVNSDFDAFFVKKEDVPKEILGKFREELLGF